VGPFLLSSLLPLSSLVLVLVLVLLLPLSLPPEDSLPEGAAGGALRPEAFFFFFFEEEEDMSPSVSKQKRDD
jgi:hypothetical protein